MQDAYQLKEVLKDKSWIDVGPGQGDKVHVEVACVEERAVFNALDGGFRARFFRCHNLESKGIGSRTTDVVTVEERKNSCCEWEKAAWQWKISSFWQETCYPFLPILSRDHDISLLVQDHYHRDHGEEAVGGLLECSYCTTM